MNFSVMLTFITMLFAAPADWTNAQAVGNLWLKAESQSTSPPVASVSPSPQPSSTPIEVVTVPTTAPTPIVSDNDAPGHEPAGGDGDGPTASPVQIQPTSEPTIAPGPSPQASATPSPASSPVSYVTPGHPGPVSSPTTTCAGLGQVGITSFGRLACPQSALFTGNTPLHHRFATLMNAGLLTIQPQNLADDYWNNGGSNGKRGGSGNLYLITNGMSTVDKTTSCSDGGDGCGKSMVLPSSFAIQQGPTDYHVSSIDLVTGMEYDAWGATNWPSVSSVADYPLAGGTGFHPGFVGAWGALAGGEAKGAADVTAQELLTYKLSGVHIGHALALLSSCVGPGTGVYPDIGQNPDTTCSGSAPAPVYGGLVHLKASYNVASDPNASDPYCAAMLYALQDYGGYTADTTGGSYGIYVYMESEGSYSTQPSDPWTSGPNIASDDLLINKGCFNAVPSSAIQAAYFSSGNPTLPTQYPYGDLRN